MFCSLSLVDIEKFSAGILHRHPLSSLTNSAACQKLFPYELYMSSGVLSCTNLQGHSINLPFLWSQANSSTRLLLENNCFQSNSSEKEKIYYQGYKRIMTSYQPLLTTYPAPNSHQLELVCEMKLYFAYDFKFGNYFCLHETTRRIGMEMELELKIHQNVKSKRC